MNESETAVKNKREEELWEKEQFIKVTPKQERGGLPSMNGDCELGRVIPIRFASCDLA
ncbi:uncharacterized protein G2W53_012613 [Senna tora]|uniref:Uncharacterized protein n=1 Tax=Senna tora TaxID=362788 RepID=A0A834TX85_9FABA|nr:uncharacterized protein G2W53_012613 [Senna tora]